MSSPANKDNRTTSRLTNRFGFDETVRGGKLAAGHGGNLEKTKVEARKANVPIERAKSMRSILALTQGCCFLVRGWRRVSQGGGIWDSEEDGRMYSTAMGGASYGFLSIEELGDGCEVGFRNAKKWRSMDIGPTGRRKVAGQPGQYKFFCFVFGHT